jgi:site-specific DNA-methyltransferase (adenine-specific)
MKRRDEDTKSIKWGHSGYPVDLPEACIILASNENDIILDLFSGSGTSAIATIKAGKGRKYIGIEKNLDYCNYAIKRIIDYEVGV